ncbi:uncharacterized protein LOC141627683 [Silene latifolia]|uniref:uncharacterized protein LOC141627683 n=1 Tax=Silene latifolia TaxID=37657 RepID=UPI003D780B17
MGFWNVRGLNSPNKQKYIKWFLQHHDIGLFGLLETKVKPSSLNRVRDSLCNGWCVSTNSQWHKGGRVWLLWKPHLYQIQFLEYNAQFIHVRVGELNSGGSFYLTLFSVLVKGWGGQSTEEEIADFQECVDCCNLVDIPATGSYFTWNNKQEAATRVYSRLDRALVNHDWINDRTDYYAHFHVEGYFDHTPCIIQRKVSVCQRKSSFKYFNMWSGVALFIPTVKKVWEHGISGTPMFQIVQKLRMLKNPLKVLNRDLFGDVENNCMRAWKYLEYIQTQLRSDPTNSDLISTELVALKEYQELQTACNSFLVQKSKAVWLTDGAFFVIEPFDIQQAFLNFYQQLLGESADLKPFNAAVVKKGSICTDEHWQILLSPVTNEEIKEALFSIPNHKAPGPDGYSSAFFKDSWEIIGGDICKAIADFFTHGRILKQINHTLVTLIPKVPLPVDVTQFRPIAYCNVLYKVISKLLCARLAKILPHIISPNQGGFIQGRNIIENILVCQDIIRLYNRSSVSPRCLIKVDLKKAYDSVNWSFLFQMLRALNFPPHFILMVQECVTTASYSLPSGLQMNKHKSNIYFLELRGRIRNILLGFLVVLKAAPFKYLGIPILFGRLGKKECQILIEKFVERIRSFGARKLSYAGRLVLVKSVLTSLFTYWANIFMIPKGVMKKIDSICKNYLWDGTSVYLRTPMVSWEKVYIRGSSWDSHVPKTHMSWNWKTVCRVRHDFKSGYGAGTWLADKKGYTVASGYQWIRHKEQKVGWAKLIWKSWALPKHKFLAWLILRNALNVKVRLFKHGICQDELCCLCNVGQETVEHVFKDCQYTSMVLAGVCAWLCIPSPSVNGLIWVGRRKWSLLKRNVCLAAFMAVYYEVWHQRNQARLEGILLRPSIVISQIQKCIKLRLASCKIVTNLDANWIASIV